MVQCRWCLHIFASHAVKTLFIKFGVKKMRHIEILVCSDCMAKAIARPKLMV